MSNKLKLTLLGLFLVQISIVAWSYLKNKQEKEQHYQVISPYLENPNAVKSLDLSHMNLKELPEEILTLKNLTTLNLSNNRFQDIPNQIYSLPNLKSLNLSHNNITKVKLYYNNSIERLDVSHNQINDIEYSYFGSSALKKLRTIDFSYNEIEAYPSLQAFSTMDTILLSNNRLSAFYKMHAYLPERVKYLDISSNEIERLKSSIHAYYADLIYSVNKCESINLSDNFFEYFPYEIFQGEVSSSIIMQKCEFNRIDNEKPTSLIPNNYTFFDFSNTDDYLDSFPFNKFINLETLHLENTRFKNCLIDLPHLSTLNIKSISIDDSLSIRCPNLERLEIDYDKISAFTDDELLRMLNLKTIVIANHPDDKTLVTRLKMLYSNVEIILE